MDLLDASSGKGRRRAVDVTTESYEVARKYMVRLGPRDFADPAWMEKLAEAGALSPAEFHERFHRQGAPVAAARG